MRRITFILYLVFCLAQHVNAQDMEPLNAYDIRRGIEGTLPSSIFWSYDSRLLYFSASRNDGLGGENYYSYDIVRNALTISRTPLHLMRFTSEQQQYFQAWGEFASLSPNGDNFFYPTVYQAAVPTNWFNVFGIASLTSNNFRFLGNPPPFVNEWRVRWSDNGRAFVLEWDKPYGGVVGFSYTLNIHSDCFCDVREIYVGELPYMSSIFDISPDGLRILYWNSYPHGLYLWDARLHAPFTETVQVGDLITQSWITGAAFSLNSASHILMVTEQGIARYNLTMGETIIVNPIIHTGWVRGAVFSPNNRWIAVTSAGYSVSTRDVYVFAVQALRETMSNPVVLDATTPAFLIAAN